MQVLPSKERNHRNEVSHEARIAGCSVCPGADLVARAGRSSGRQARLLRPVHPSCCGSQLALIGSEISLMRPKRAGLAHTVGRSMTVLSETEDLLRTAEL